MAAQLPGPPPVSHAVGRSVRLAALLAAPWLLGAGCAAYAVHLGSARVPSLALAGILVCALAFSAVTLALFWWRQSPGQLAWDGAQWRLQNETRDRHCDAWVLSGVEVRLDLQTALLLQAWRSGRRRGVWLWAEANDDRARWHLLRCALYSGACAGDDPALPPDARQA